MTVHPANAQIDTTIGGSFSADLNKGAGGRVLFLCVARGGGPPVTNVVVLFPDKGENFPQGSAPTA